MGENMKKLLLATAVFSVAAAGAHAQSSVTLYGLINSGLTYVNNSKGGALVQTQSGAYTGSRWGLKGREDLGNGLAAVFVLENGFDGYKGTLGQNGREFGRQAYVGLSSPWGTVTAGRQYEESSTFVSKVSASGLWAGYIGSHPGDVDNVGSTNRVNNTIKYTSPTFNGLTVGGLYSLGGVAGSFSSHEVFSLGGSYENGPVLIAAAYENIHNPGFTLYDGTDPVAGSLASYKSPASNPMFAGYESASNMQVFGGGATYAFGALKIGAVYTNTQFRNVIATPATPRGGSHTFANYEANVVYQATTPLSFGASYDYLKADDAHYSQVQAGTHYAISKRTQFYVIGIWQHAAGIDSTGQAAVANITTLSASSTPNQVAVTTGIIHTF